MAYFTENNKSETLPKSHHRHFLGREKVEVWQGLEKTIAAFQQDIETIKTRMRERKL